jgi:NADH-quinone oxidoreductase subunit J
VGGAIAFWIMAPVSVISAVAMVLSRKPVHSALWLVVNFFTLAVFFLILGSPFLFVVQIIVYAGAIMVLFLFVIMLLGVDREQPLIERIKGQRLLSLVLGLGLIVGLFVAIGVGIGFARQALPDFGVVNKGGNVRALADVLFNKFFFPFEVTSVLLIIAAIGAVMHGRRRITQEDTIDLPVDEAPGADGPRGDGRAEAPVGAVAGNGSGSDRATTGAPAETGGGS